MRAKNDKVRLRSRLGFEFRLEGAIPVNHIHSLQTRFAHKNVSPSTPVPAETKTIPPVHTTPAEAAPRRQK